MILSDNTINEYIDKGVLVATPIQQDQIQPASLDITLGTTFSRAKAGPHNTIDFDHEIEYEKIMSNSYLLLPGQFVLATTGEYFELPDDITAFVEGRSSLGRMGLFIQNAGWVDPGFKGEITLELFNASAQAIELKAGRRVGQLVFAKMDRAANHPYSGKYQNQRGATGSKMYMDRKRAQF